MSTHEKDTFQATYGWASEWSQLPWSHAQPTLFLAEICQNREAGTALDIGCGAGTDSVFLARQGWDVTALDFIDKALEFTTQRATEAGVSVTPVEADITTWEPDRQYDLILDHGLLHNMDPVRYAAYREVLLKALAPDGDFVLLHWHPLFPGQENGKMGPTRRSRQEIKEFFAPELQERFYAREEFEDLPSLVGKGMSQAYYWFRPNEAHRNPEAVIEQISATLAGHGIDVEAAIAEYDVAASPVSDELLSWILGPGRLGIVFRVPAESEVPDYIAAFARAAGREADWVAKLLRVFADHSVGNVCIEDARCTECQVSLCKRLRYR